MAKPLSGKVALVTGATRGIGRAVALRLLAEGAHVIAAGTGRGPSAPENCEFMAADFTVKNEVLSLAEQIAKRCPDILVNSAGINKIGPFGDIDLADFSRIQKVNVEAPFILCRAAVPGMKRKGWGRIVNVCSVWGKIGKELRASYSASKFALAGMTAALAAEVARDGTLANCVSPGPIETEMTRSVLSQEMLEGLIASVPAGRLGAPDEVAALIAWLVGPENTFVTGQNIAIDGGMTRV